ncbi:MAG: methionine synthase [Alkalispirochaetaceae bacterium]
MNQSALSHLPADVVVISEIPFSLNRKHFKKMVRTESYPELEDELDRFLDSADAVTRPKAMYREDFVEEVGEEAVKIAGAEFTSEILAEKLGVVPRVFPYIATCGAELDEMDLSEYDMMLSGLWHSTYKMQALGAAANHLKKLLKERFEIKILSSINPGSGNVDVWPVDQQIPLFSLFGDTEAALGVRLTDSCLMVPDKTISGIYFPSKIEYCNCHSCTRENCPSRRAPYEGPSDPLVH